MKNNWSKSIAKKYIKKYEKLGFSADLGLRVYTTRLLGRNKELVLHGGGNTSVKTTIKDIDGKKYKVLCVKGSGWDMADIEPPGLPAVKLEPLLSLKSKTLSNLLVSPTLALSFSISSILLAVTLYCFPPVSIIANDIKSLFLTSTQYSSQC